MSRGRAYREGVMATIPNDLPDGAWLAMMEERGIDPIDYALENEHLNTSVRPWKPRHVQQTKCDVCGKKMPDENRMRQHRKAAHGRGCK